MSVIGSISIFVVLFSTISSIGLSSLITMPNNMTINVLPFLVLGLGVNDIFVLIKATELNPNEKPSTMIYRTLNNAGVAITMTSFANFSAFIVGALIPINLM